MQTKVWSKNLWSHLGSVTQPPHRLATKPFGGQLNPEKKFKESTGQRQVRLKHLRPFAVKCSQHAPWAQPSHGRDQQNAGSNNQARNAVAQSYGGYIRRPLADRGALLRVGLPICSRVGGTREGAPIRIRSITHRHPTGSYPNRRACPESTPRSINRPNPSAARWCG